MENTLQKELEKKNLNEILIEANELQNEGKALLAEELYLKILDIRHDHPDANHNLSILLIEQNRLKEAKKYIEELIKTNYPLPQYYITSSKFYEIIGDLNEAIKMVDVAISLSKDEEKFKSYYLKGILLSKTNKGIEALKYYERCLKTHPENITILNTYGTSLAANNKILESITIFQKINDLNPDFFDAHVNLGLAYQKTYKYNLALESYNKALQINPDHFMLYINIGSLYQSLRNSEKALENYNKAKEIRPDDPEVYNNIAIIYGESGDRDSAYKYYKKSLDLKPFNPRVFRHICLTKILKINDPLVEMMSKKISQESTNDGDKVEIAFGLGSLFESHGKYDEAFNFFKTGNDLLRSKSNYNIKEVVKTAKSILNDYPLDINYKNQMPFSPVFIIGMPRSATTLVESIITNEPNIDPMGELTYISSMALQIKKDGIVGPSAAKKLKIDNIEILEKIYINQVLDANPEVKSIFTDKMPYNFLHVGFIKTIFPKSKIIYTTRDSRDNCISIYNLKLFGTHLYSNNLEDLAKYYNLHADMMKHWNKIYPDEIYNFKYENFVKDPTNETRNLFNYLEVPYKKEYERFDLNNSNFRTASNFQVKEKLNNASIGRWKNYKNHIEQLIDTLDKKSFIN